MKAFSRLSALAWVVVFLAAGVGCGKETSTKEVANASQDTMLMHDLAEANRNTAAASVLDNSLNTVKTSDSGAVPAAGGAPSTPSDTKVVPRPSPVGSEILTSAPRMTPPTKANDASGPTTVPISRSPASGSQSSSRDPCDSATPVDQRSCLNRSIAAGDLDLNRTYQALLAQAQKSGGSDLQDRFQQSQREWITQRDSDCTTQTPSANGKLWAKARARCLADYSEKRTSELQRNLNNLRGQ